MESRIIIIISLLLVLSSCKVNLIELRSTSQKWCVPNNNIHGINYHFTLKTQADYTSLKIDSIKLHNKWLKNFHYSVIGKSNTETKFFKGDTILISVNMMDTLYDGSVLIHYSFKNKLKLIPIIKIINLKSLCP